MRKTSLLAAALLAGTVSGVPEFVAAMGSNNPTPPQSSQPSGTTTKQKTKKQKSGSSKEFLDRYHAAYALIYDKGDYQAGIIPYRFSLGPGACERRQGGFGPRADCVRAMQPVDGVRF